MLLKRGKNYCNRKSRLCNKRSWNLSGGLEGLPLQLIIMMIIAAIGVGIVVAWLNVFSEKPLHEVEVDDIVPTPTKGALVLTNGDSYTIKVRALNTDQKPLKGVTIVLEGPGVSKIATTNAYGLATFADVRPVLGSNENLGLISVTGTYRSWSVTGPSIGIET